MTPGHPLLSFSLKFLLCLLFTAPASFLCSASVAFAWQGKVVAVAEADSLFVMHETKRERIDLYGIDCPEKRQNFGDVSKTFTMSRLQGKVVDVEPIGKNRYGQPTAIVTVNGRIMNVELLKSGLAWVHSQSCTRPECKEWKEIQRTAKREKVGLWSEVNPIPPWEFRKAKQPSIKPVYSGNIVTHVFHSTNCEEYDCWNCIAVFKGREAAVNAGYKPCELCSP